MKILLIGKDLKVIKLVYFSMILEKHQNQFNIPERIGVQFECMFTDIDARIDLSVSKDISLEHFEIMAKTFIDAMAQYCH